MPSRPLSPDRAAVVRLHTRVGVRAQDLAKRRTTMGPAVAELALTVPPARLDLVNEVLTGWGRHRTQGTDWPPMALVYELLWRIKRVQAGEMRLRGPNGEVITTVEYTDKLGHYRRVYRLTQHGRHIGDYSSVEELGKHVSLAELIEDDPAVPDADPQQGQL